MRLTHVASLFLVPALAVAPAFARAPKSDSTASTSTVRVSTGIVAPVILNPADIRVPAGTLANALGGEATVVLRLSVDEQGHAQDVRVVKSAGVEEVDSRVVAGVEQARFRPAQLNNQSIPMAMSLVVRVQR